MLRANLIRLAHSMPKSSERTALLELVAGEDPAVRARNMLDNGGDVVKMLERGVADVAKGLAQAKREAEGLDRLGSGTMSAPTLLKAKVQRNARDLAALATDIADSIDEVLSGANFV